jgi:hypothetical protein
MEHTSIFVAIKKVRNTNKAFKHWLLVSTIRYVAILILCLFVVGLFAVAWLWELLDSPLPLSPPLYLSSSLPLYMSSSISFYIYLLYLSLSVYLGIFPSQQSNKHCTCIIDGFRWTVAWGLIQQRQFFYKLDLLA